MLSMKLSIKNEDTNNTILEKSITLNTSNDNIIENNEKFTLVTMKKSKYNKFIECLDKLNRKLDIHMVYNK